MSATTEAARSGLSDYEAGQVREIAAWKSEPPNPFSELFKRAMLPGARLVESVIPDQVVRAAIEKAYDAAELSAFKGDVKAQAGVGDLATLREKPLGECDKLAKRIGSVALSVSTVEGAATGAGGPLTTLFDIPLLFTLSIRTILKIGYCYGYELDQARDRAYVLGVLMAATSSTLDVRRTRLNQLREVEEMLLEETQEDVIAEEVASFLFQMEVFADIPGVGAVSGALLNLSFIRRVEITAIRVFQERWLRDQGKVDRVEPAEAHARALAGGWSGALRRAAYSGCYYVGFGLTFPAWYVASLFPRLDNAVARGARAGAAAAEADVDRLLARPRGAAAPAPALAPA
jgi:hypothetical protein